MSRVIDAVLRLRDEFTQPLSKSIDLMTSASKEGNKTRKAIEKFGNGIAKTGAQLTTAITVPVLAAGAASVKAATDWETAFTGVKKTVDATEAEYDKLGKGIQQMATETSSSMEEIAGVAEVAGQLGISKDNLLDFTRTMVQLGDTTNLSAEEAATSLARFLNITRESTGNIDKIGAAIVDLGNNFATDEASIVAMSTRLAAAGTLAGMSSTDILALSTAMSSVGIEAEAGGTAMTQTLTAVEAAVADFSTGSTEDLEAIAEVANTSAADFAQKWKSEPIKAVQEFITGLGRLDEKGESATLVLDELGMSGVRQSNMLKSLGLASDVLANAIDTSSAAYKANTALTDEASKRYSTFASQANQLKEQFKMISISIGQMLMPYMQQAVAWVQNLVDKFNSLDEGTKESIVKFALMAAAAGPLITGFGKMITMGSKLLGVFANVRGILSGVSAAGGVLKFALAALTSPIGLVVAACVAIAAIIAVVITHFDQFKAAASNVSTTIAPYIEQLKEAFTGLWNTVSPIITLISDLIASVLVGAFEGMLSTASIVIDGITTVITGLKDYISGFVNLITAIAHGDWAAAWDAFKDIVKGKIEVIVGLIEGVVGIVTGLINAIAGAGSKVAELAAGSGSKSTAASGKSTARGAAKSLPGNATGTTNWRGGWTRVNEKGGEIMNLPSGTQIIPHDASRNTPLGGNINIAKLADSIVVREDADIDRIGDAIVRKLSAACSNRGGLMFSGNMA